jgi:polyferredoxin
MEGGRIIHHPTKSLTQIAQKLLSINQFYLYFSYFLIGLLIMRILEKWLTSIKQSIFKGILFIIISTLFVIASSLLIKTFFLKGNVTN